MSCTMENRAGVGISRGVYDKSETSVCRRCWPAKAGSMRPRKCASVNFPWWPRQYPSFIYGELCLCAASCRVVLLLEAGAERVVCLGGQGRASHDGTPAMKL